MYLSIADCQCRVRATSCIDKSGAKPCLMKVIEMNKELCWVDSVLSKLNLAATS